MSWTASRTRTTFPPDPTTRARRTTTTRTRSGTCSRTDRRDQPRVGITQYEHSPGRLLIRFRLAELKHTTLRPSSASAFSSSLQHLISLPSTSSNPVPKVAPPSAATLRLERKTCAVIRETKAAHLARGHVRDVIGGWGPRPPLPFSEWESKAARDFERAKRGGTLVDEGETSAEREKRLRKLAQRGVVRLFNAIGAAQGVAGKDKDVEEQEKRKKLAIKATAKDGETESQAVSRRPNILGARGKNDARESHLARAPFSSTDFDHARQSRVCRRHLSSTSSGPARVHEDCPFPSLWSSRPPRACNMFSSTQSELPELSGLSESVLDEGCTASLHLCRFFS